MITKEDIKILKTEEEKVLSYSINGVYVDNRKDNDLKKSIKRTINLLKSRWRYSKEEDNLKNINLLKRELEVLN